jgi:hypothetical protein
MCTRDKPPARGARKVLRRRGQTGSAVPLGARQWLGGHGDGRGAGGSAKGPPRLSQGIEPEAHIKGLGSFQTKEGCWHELIDRNDSYLETSATAIYAYAIGRSVKRGYVDKEMYGPMAISPGMRYPDKLTQKAKSKVFAWAPAWHSIRRFTTTAPLEGPETRWASRQICLTYRKYDTDLSAKETTRRNVPPFSKTEFFLLQFSTNPSAISI